MSAYKFTLKRFWGSLLVLTQLFAILVPANARSVSAQSPPCAGTSVQSTTVATGALPAADQQVTIPKDILDLAALEAIWRFRYTDAEKLYQVFVESIVLNSEQTLDVAKFFKTFEENFEKAIPPADLNNQNYFPYDDILHTMFDVALKMPEIAPIVPTVWKEMNELNNPGGFNATWFGDSASKISASAHRYSLAVRVVENAAEIFAQARDCAKKNPALAGAFDEFFGEGINGWLKAISAQAYVEAADYIASTRRELDLTIRIAQIEGLSSPTADPQPIYLPLIAH